MIFRIPFHSSVSTGMNLGLAILLGAAISAAPAMAGGNDSCSTPPSQTLVSTLAKQAPGLKPEVLRLGMVAAACATERGLVTRPDILTVIDYSIPSTEPRLFVFNVSTKRLLFREHVAHGRNSGGNLTTKFSNVEGSLATSLGLFVTANTYMGSNGYSLRLKGLERGINDRAWERAIVMHGAKYVNAAAAKASGRLGRSWGCPAVRSSIAKQMIDTVKGGSPIFAYYPDQKWLSASSFMPGATTLAAVATPAGSATARR